MGISEMLKQRNLPDLTEGGRIQSREDWEAVRPRLLKLLAEEEYGFLPPAPKKLTWEVVKSSEGNVNGYCSGKAVLTEIRLTAELEQGTFSFPVFGMIPVGEGPFPAVVHINFRNLVPDAYMPTEEICDRGFAVFSFGYEDVTSDDDDFGNGLAGVFYRGRERTGTDPGKISFWAWAAIRVRDYMETLPQIDQKRTAVLGHSRLGKTALWAGAWDPRFQYVISNESGCSGAALSRGKTGERIRDICQRFPYWFCANYQKYMDREETLPFDQHLLLAMTAPRELHVASAEDDLWSDPLSEYLGCAAAAPVYQLYGRAGVPELDRVPKAGDTLPGDGIFYHHRSGGHYLSRYDWNRLMDNMERQHD